MAADVVEAYVASILDHLNRRDCRRVVGRSLVGDGRTPPTVTSVRCDDPAHPECVMDYCPEHCAVLCRGYCAGGGGGDEDDDAEPVVWVPKRDQAGRERIEARSA